MYRRYPVDRHRERASDVFTDEFLRQILSDRERQIQERIRVRRLIGPKHPTIRWRSGRRQVGKPDAQEG